MPRFVVVEQGARETAARMVVDAPTQQDAAQRATAAGWKVASVTVEGDLEGPATVEQLRAKLSVLEQRMDELHKLPALRLTFWRVFAAALLAALAMWPLVLLLGRMFGGG